MVSSIKFMAIPKAGKWLGFKLKGLNILGYSVYSRMVNIFKWKDLRDWFDLKFQVSRICELFEDLSIKWFAGLDSREPSFVTLENCKYM